MTTENERLARLVQADSTMTFFSCDDREHPGIQWTVYGLPGTNEIVVCAEVSGKEFYQAAPSRLTYPAMIDRRFGIDVEDNQLAEELSSALWEEHGEELATLIENSRPS